MIFEFSSPLACPGQLRDQDSNWLDTPGGSLLAHHLQPKAAEKAPQVLAVSGKVSWLQLHLLARCFPSLFSTVRPHSTPTRTFDDAWRHFRLSQPGEGMPPASDGWSPAMQRTFPRCTGPTHTTNCWVLAVNSAQAEESWGTHFTWIPLLGSGSYSLTDPYTASPPVAPAPPTLNTENTFLIVLPPEALLPLPTLRSKQSPQGQAYRMLTILIFLNSVTLYF